jgi:hypothetical protein
MNTRAIAAWTKRAALLAGIGVASVGCIDVHSIHMPSGAGGSAGGGGDSAIGDGGPSSGAAGGADASAGDTGPSRSWTGYIEQYAFPSGSAALKLTVSTDEQGVATGAIVFGQGTPPPPVVDPTVGYPPDFVAQALKHGGAVPTSSWFYMAEGYAYPIDGTLDAEHLQFRANLAQLWSDWCVLQQPPGLDFGPCFTVPSGRQRGSSYSADLQTCSVTNYVEELPVDCGRLLLCGPGGSVCSCTTSACSPGTAAALFDVFVTEGTMSGSVNSWFGRYNVHFVAD